MPFEKEALEIKDFKYGTIKRSDPLDIPLSAASDSNNIDGDAPEGRLQGIPKATAINVAQNYIGFNAKRSAWIIGSDGKWNLVYVSGDADNTIQVIKDWYGTPTDSGVSKTFTGGNAYSIVAHGQEAHIGTGQLGVATTEPQWVGYCNFNQFTAGSLGWVLDDCKLTNPFTVSGLAHVGTTEIFDKNKDYQYAVSAVYDYTQESPLYVDPNAYGGHGLNLIDYITIYINWNSYSTTKKDRITACNLYQREILISDYTEKSSWRFIKTFDVTGIPAHTDYTWVFGSPNWATTILNTDPIGGQTYEASSGIPETLTDSSMKYTLNCECNNYMFVAGCAKTDIADASHMVFRSKALRYDMFNWSAVGEFIKLPTQPTALVSFNNRVWAFDENNIYIINPDSMIVESSITGIGCLSQRSILVTPYGMYWCDEKNAYWHDGSTLNPISESIKADTGAWHGFPLNYSTDKQDTRPIVVFSPVKNSILFMIPYNGSSDMINVWAFHIRRKRWDAWTNFIPDCGVSCGAFTGKNGEVIVGDGISSPNGKVYDSLGSTDKRDWYWISKEIDFDMVGQYKKYYYLYHRNTVLTAAPVFSYDATNSGSFTNITNADAFGSGSWVKSKTLKIKVAEAVGYKNTVDAIEIIYRRMDGSR